MGLMGLLSSESEPEDEPPKIMTMKLRKWYDEYDDKKLHKLKDLTKYFKQNEHLPGLKDFQDRLKEDDFVVFTNHINNRMYKELQELMGCIERSYKTFILENMQDRYEMESILSIIAKNKFPPHLFYQGKYIQSGRRLEKVFTNCDIERIIGMVPAVIRMDVKNMKI